MRFTYWTYRAAIKHWFDIEYHAFCWPNVHKWYAALQMRRRIEARRRRELGF